MGGTEWTHSGGEAAPGEEYEPRVPGSREMDPAVIGGTEWTRGGGETVTGGARSPMAWGSLGVGAIVMGCRARTRGGGQAAARRGRHRREREGSTWMDGAVLRGKEQGRADDAATAGEWRTAIPIPGPVLAGDTPSNSTPNVAEHTTKTAGL